MNDINHNQQNNETENKTKTFWKNFGIVALSIALAVLTVVVMNLNG